ncbi:uncharacterized protein LOC108903288 [Anoplophora glabripennis]|uniref:uncharacterized protein LOC108903288 n=1 Tax=Anoplophora glabripennis TaxID=217634 RepID=UPI0008746408|nr:uncharacterized protein LOC108903288 [Anoplophora glabripennis]
MAVTLFLLVGTILCFEQASGHGMMLDPSNRASLWRVYDSLPKNYQDNQFFCGGFQVQYEENGGECGPCGDNYADAQPRSNENTGTYGLGIIAGTYTVGSVINVSSTLTANHLGSISYSICVLEDHNAPESEDCFQGLTLADGSASFTISSTDFDIVNQVQLPEGLTCERCVLRWHYRCGNNWGDCGNGTGAIGCGNQETFRSCADILIE